MNRSGGKNGVAQNLILAEITNRIDDLKARTEPSGRPDAYRYLDHQTRQDLQDSWPDFVQRCPNPTLRWNSSTTKQDQDGGRQLELVNPELFKLWNCEVVYWAPHIFFDVGMPNCPLCRSNSRVETKGWERTSARRVVTPTHTIWVAGYRYVCVECPSKCYSLFQALHKTATCMYIIDKEIIMCGKHAYDLGKNKQKGGKEGEEN